MQQRQNALGYFTSMVWDSAGRSIATVDALGNRSSTIYDIASQRIASVDVLSRTTTSVLDAIGRTIAVVSPLGYINSMGYDAAGRQVTSQNALGAVSSSLYDVASRLTATISPLGYVVSNFYDAADQPVARQDALGFLSSTVFDAAGRRVAAIDALNGRWTTVYDAANQRVATVDALSNRTTSSFAANGWNTATQDARGFITSFVRDAAGQQICVVDANGGRLTSLYDLRGIVYATQDQLGAFTSFSHDAVGNTILRVDARNWPTTYTNDALNRPAQTVYINGTRVTNTSFALTPSSRRAAQRTRNAAGEQITSQDVTGTTSMGYDLNGRNVYQQFPTGIALTNTFDGANNRLTQADPWGVTSNTYDIQSRLTGIVNPLAERTTIQWDAVNREQTKTLGNGMVVTRLYDANGNELVLSNVNAVGAALFVVSNTYDAVNNRVSMLELDGTQVQARYDATRQLINEQRTGANAYNISYVWDAVGNRTQENSSGQITSRTFNAANSQLVMTPPSGAATTSTYDPIGNLLTQTTGTAITTNTWSPENQVLQEVKADGTTESYLYAQNGQRKQKTNASGTTNFTWDNQNIILESTPAGVLQARNTNNPGTWGGLVSQNRSGTSSFYGFDSQRSTRVLVSSAGSTTDIYLYTLFGVELLSGSGTVNPFRFGGQVGYFRDFGNEMDIWWRKLSAVNGTWNSQDRIGLRAGDINFKRFVGNNPVVWVDPSGLFPSTLCVRIQMDITSKCQDYNLPGPGGKDQVIKHYKDQKKEAHRGTCPPNLPCTLLCAYKLNFDVFCNGQSPASGPLGDITCVIPKIDWGLGCSVPGTAIAKILLDRIHLDVILLDIINTMLGLQMNKHKAAPGTYSDCDVSVITYVKLLTCDPNPPGNCKQQRK